MRSAWICGCLVALAAVVPGCGSSGSDTTTRPSTAGPVTTPAGPTSTGGGGSSSAQAGTNAATSSFAARADAVCTRYQAQRRQIFSQLRGRFRPSSGTRSGPQGPAAAYRQAVDSGRQELVELRGLPVPANQAGAARRYFSAAEATLNDLDRVASAFDSPGNGALRTAGPTIRADALRAYQLARAVGFRVCGELR